MNIAQMDIISYLTYLGTGIVMLLVFSKIYFVLTPYDELALIRQGRGAACVSLSGTLIGFSLTLAAGAIYNNSLIVFIVWGVLSMLVQLLGYLVIIKIIGDVEERISKNNVATGSLIGLTGLVLGILNAGCLS
ncbi:MAG: DUF350 domain-containing protein [Gammaproteobacteria bacterium]|nr:MAG: DUF350 domain-containing protein [Gammaproteobacteria bacterium]